MGIPNRGCFHLKAGFNLYFNACKYYSNEESFIVKGARFSTKFRVQNESKT